jgi:hypothetical protein
VLLDGNESRVARGGVDGVNNNLLGERPPGRLNRADAAAQVAAGGFD